MSLPGLHKNNNNFEIIKVICNFETVFPNSEFGLQVPAWPQVGKLVVACRWSAVYSTEP